MRFFIHSEPRPTIGRNTRHGVVGRGTPVEEPLFANVPTSRFDVVLMDPPWAYTGDPDKDQAAGKHYQTHTRDEIREFPLTSVLAKDAVVFCWTTGPQLAVAIDLLVRDWRLYYRGVAFVWVKTTKNGEPIGAQGVRPSIVKPTTEFVLAASNVRSGRPLPLASEKVRQVVMAQRVGHSIKPPDVHERIEAMYPNARKLELFARRKRDGWTCWGNEV